MARIIRRGAYRDLLCAPLHDAIEAALGLADSANDEDISERLKSSPWFQLAALAAADAEIVAPERTCEEHPGVLAHRRTQQSYVLAKMANSA